MKFLRYIQKKRRAILAMAALTLFASPFSAQASNITTKDGVTLNPTNNVYNIEVQDKLSDSVGVNKFTHFNLDSGQIANMQFGTLNTLANLVDNRININGTVNALRDGKIGGNLYFLSPNGIAVGASGVINAGAFTGIAVSQDYFDKLSGLEDATKFTNALKADNIEYNNDPDKGIDIQGVINAPGGISLYATKINVANGATLRTDIEGIDFKKVVNIEGVSSGITGGLDASYKDGDIVLKAYAEEVLDDSTLETEDEMKEAFAKWDKISEREATINVDGTIKSAGDVSINAESVITFKEGEKFNAAEQTKGISDFLKNFKNDWSVNYAKKTNKATVNIGKDADIYSAGDMDISATANLTAKIATVTPAKDEGNSWVPATAVGVIVAENEAVVNVKGKLESGGTMAINANTETSLTVDAQTKTAADNDEDKYFIGVGVITGTSNAEINIESGSEIKSSGSDSDDAKAFEAVATVKNTISNSATASSEDKSTINTAVGVTSYTSNAIVNVQSDIVADNGSIKIDATNTTSNTNSTSNVFGSSVAPFENPFEAEEEEEDTSGSEDTSGNENTGGSENTGGNEDNESGAVDAVNDAIKDAMDKVKEKISSSDDSSGDSDAAPTADQNTVPESAGGSTFAKVLDGSYFKAGAAVGVFSQSNNAKVNVAKGVNLTANKDVTLNAQAAITRQKLSVESSVNNQTDEQSTAAMIGLGVLVSDIDNNADVIVDGSLKATNGDVKITSDSGMNYNQFEALVEDLTDQFKKIKEDAEEIGDTVKEKFEGYENEVTDVLDNASDDPAEFMSNLSTLSTTVNNISEDIKKINKDSINDSQLKKDIDELPSKLTAFLRPVNYSNYYVRSAFVDTQAADSASSTKIDAAGSFSIDSMLNNSRIMINSGSNINAPKGTVEIDSGAKGRVVAITGMGGEYLQSSTASNAGAGVSVIVGKFDNNALVTVGKSELKGNDIKIKSEDYSKHVNLIYGNGKADSTSITGMVSYIKSPTDSIISIDDSAKLNAADNINLEASGEDYITSVNGAVTLGNGNGKSFGAAINVLSNDKNTAVVVGDNGKVSGLDDKISSLEKAIETEAAKDSPDADTIISDKSDLKILKITKRTQDILGEELLEKVDASAVNADGVINAKNLTVKADNTGVINAIAVEGTENSESHGMADAFNNNVTRGQTAINYSNDAFKAMPDMLSKVFNKKKKSSSSDSSGDSDAAPPALDKSGKDTPTNAQNDANTNAGGDESPAPPVDTDNASSQLNIAGAGSGAINITGGETGSYISNANITAENVDVSANDDVFHGSWAGAGAFNFFGKSSAAKNTNVAIGGSVAYTDTNQNVGSIIRSSKINNATSIKNTASRDDSDVSAGLGLAVSTNKGEQGSNVDVAISASINFIEGDTHALLIDNTVTGGTIENKASLDSLQVAGGVDIALSTGGNSGVNIGGSGVASKISNDLQSGIFKGSYTNLGNVDINANKKSNQIDAAVGGGATFGSNAKGFAFGGAVAVSDITNSSRAFLNSTTAFESIGTVNVDALDTKNSSARSEYLSSRSITTDPTSFLADDDKSKVHLDGGNSIVNVALGMGGSTGESGTGSIGVSYAGIANLMNVDINDNTLITAKNLNANINAKVDDKDTGQNNVVNVTVGLAGSNKSFAGAGAAGVTDIKNDAVINVNSNITADNFLSAANSSTHIVNVAGQAALANSLAGGLTFAYNAMDNNTASNVNGGTLNVKNLSSTATNSNYALAVGAGGTYSKSTGAINGAVGLNMGDNSTNATVNNATINNVNALNVTATDDTSKTTIAGDINISNKGKIAIGGAVAYANIGSSDDKEILNAKITNSTITTTDNGAINVQTADNASMTTVGVGLGIAVSEALGSFNGAAAVSEVNKENIAEISNTGIDEGNATGNANVTINAASGKNTPDKITFTNDNDEESATDVDNKINTAAAVLDLNFSSNSWVNGAVAVAVNKFNQSTEANFKHDSISDKASNVGNVSMNSNSNADILGVAIGGAGGKSTLSAAGSVSYNYIDNTAKSLVENENVKATKNFGVVAQSDDLLANYAGALDVDVGGRGSVGVSVAYNEIKGNTDALVNNSKLEVTGSSDDAIEYSNPDKNLLDNYVKKDMWTSTGLLSGRKSENKSGVVVNSSATHSISSDLATIGVRLSNNLGVGVSGTVNINKIDGATNAKVVSTDLTAGNADSFVNAADYTNNGSFVGNAAISGSVAVGVLWNENQVNRKTNALVDGGTLNVNSLDVKADSRQGISNLNIAVGASFATDKSQVFAAASGDNIVRNQMESTTTAKIENAIVNHSGAVNVDAYHKDNAYATNLAVGAAFDTGSNAGATFDMGYGLMRENSTVQAEINNSTLTSSSGAVNVNAENDSKIAGAFGTAGIAVHAGSPGAAASVAVGINNNYIENNVHAGITSSTLNVGAVDVNAKNSSEIKADGGVAALSLNLSKTFFASMGAAVAVTNATFDNRVTADVDNSTITAGGDVNINARDDHKSDETVVSAAMSSGVAIEVNRMSTSVNSGLANLTKDDLEDLTKTVSTDDLMDIEDPSKASAESASDKLTGEYGNEERFLDDDTIDTLLGGVKTDSSETNQSISDTLKKRYTATVNQDNSLDSGVFASVTNNSTIEAGENNISINATENNDLSITSGGGNAALIGGIGVGSTSIDARRANTAKVSDSTLNANNIDITTTNGQTGSDGILSKMYNATLSPVGVSVGYNNVETNGTAEISISNSKITAGENLNATATDTSKSKSYILDAGIKQIGYTGVFAYNTNTSETGIEVNNQSALSANAINFDTENHSHRATDTLAISVNGTLGVQTSTSEANDASSNFIKVSDAGNSFTADTLNFNALNGSQTYANINGQAYVGLNAIVANGFANSETTSAISIANANNFANATINLTAQVGEDGKYTAESEGFAINASSVGVNIDNMTAKTKSNAQISIGNEIYGEDTTLNVNALNKASRNAFMRNNAYALVANANDISSYTIAKDSSSISVGSDTALDNANKLAALNITADTENKSYVAAKGTGGAIGGDFGSAAHADNSVDNSSSATLKGTWNIANDLTLNANQHDGAYISGYSARGAILTGGKGSLDNEIKGSSTATISEGATINAKTVNVNAKNYITTDKYSSDYDHTLYGLMIGVVDDVDYQRSSATTNKSANINIGDNVGITTTGTQVYDAASDYDLKNDVYAEGGSALASLRWVKSHNYITADEKISVGTGATLKNEGGSYADGGITLAAHDNLEHNPAAKGASDGGAGGYVRAENLTELNRNQTIDINGTLKSAKDLNLYAGADTDGNGSKVHSYARAISQVLTLIDDGGADVIRRGATNSNVNVNSGAVGQAVHDVNIISNAGFEAYEERPFYGSTWKSRGKYSVVTSDVGNLTTSDYKHTSKVKVDGELKAASNPEVTINISGVALPDGFILANNKFKNLSYNVQSGDTTITKRNTDFTGKSSEEIFAQQIFNGISTSSVDYANDVLKARYEEVCKEIVNYEVADRNDVAAYNGFLHEKTALEAEMDSLGLGSYTTNSDGTTEFKIGTTPLIGIKTVVLPDVEVSGGNINVVTNDFTGSGKLNASGVPKIDVENNSTAYLVASKLTIADKGGAINFNDKSVSSNSAVNDINSSNSGAAFVDMNVTTSAEVPTIKVANNYAGQTSIPMKPNPNAEGYSDLENDAKNATLQYTPINYIELSGNVTNPVGKVIIQNKQGSIRVNKGALVNGLDIEMTAKGSISQGYTKGIVNVTYTPQDAYKETFAKMRSEFGWDSSMPTKDQIETKTSDYMYSGGEAWHAGDAIYISAQDININGLIQAGYAGFEASVSQEDIDNATETTLFNGVTMYKVNEGGYKLDKKKGYYVYEPQIYYDKASNQLYVEDISSTGGKVYLAGRIFSTGNGKIVIGDGASNIDIKNNTALDMNVGKVTSAAGEGLIQIADTEQDKLVEYSSGQTRTIENYSAWLANNNNGIVTTSDGLTAGNFVNYTPQSGLTYSWSEGTRKEQTVHYYYKEEKSWWGARGDSYYTSDLAKMSAKLSPSYSEPVKTETLTTNDEVYYINTQNKVNNNLTLFAQNVVTNESYGHHEVDGPDKHGFFGFYEDYTHRWQKDTGSKQIYQYSIKADYPISVGIIGEKNPHINLTNASTSGGDLYLTGDIRNDIGAELNIRATGGKIEQSEGVKISTNNINLNARTGVKNIDVVTHRTDDLKLNARTTAGDIDVNVSGGSLGDETFAGNVIVDALKSSYGGVMLTAQGDIKQEIDGASVNAQNIKLESTDGSINLQVESNGQSANVSAISAAAHGDINLVKTDENDFLVGSIVSTNGDVTLTANGKFVDALDKVRDNTSTDESDLVKSWIDMGLIAGTDDYKSAYLTRLEKDRDDYKADVTELFSEYKTLLTTYQSALDDYNALEDKSGITAPEMSDRLILLDDKFKNYETADAYLAADTDYQTLVETVANPQYQWTKDELLSGIRSSIVNKEEGTAHDVTRLKDANITGKNVTLTGAGVGTNSKEVTTIKMSELRPKANETAEEKSARMAKISQLANVEAADVNVNLVLDANGNPVTQTIERVNYRYDADKGYYIDTAGNYVRYRKDADGNLLKYTYDANLEQVGDAVAVSDFSDVIESTKTIENKEIESFEISGTIPLGINATSNITVTTTGNDGIYIVGRNKGVKITETTNPNNDIYSPLNINKIESTKTDGNYGDVRIIGEAGIFNTANSGANVIAKDLILVGGDDSIGTQKKPVAMQLTGDLLNARSNGEVNLQKIGVDNFRISSVYSPKAIRIANNENGIIERSLRFDDIDEAHIITPGEITLTGSAGTANLPLSIKASETTVLNLKGRSSDFYIKGISGTLTLNDIAGNVDISSDGSIGQTSGGASNLTSIKVAANGDVILDGAKNKLSEIYLGAIGGNFELENASKKLTATFAGTVGGTATINQRDDINLAGSGNANVLNLTSEKGDIISTGGLKATEEINLSVGTFTHEGEIHTDKLTIATDSGVTINNAENTFNSLEISSRDGNAIKGSIDVAIKADTFAPSIKNDVTGDVTLENTKTGGAMSFGSGEAISIDGTFTATTDGNFDYGSTLNAGKGISITAQNIYRSTDTTGNFATTGRLLLNSQNNVGTAKNPIWVGNTANKSAGLDIYGKGIYVNGVNSGILTLGDVIGTSFNVSSEGAIAQADGKRLNLTGKVTVSAADNVTLDNADNVINAIGSVTAGGDASISSLKSLALSGKLDTKNLSLKSEKAITSSTDSEVKVTEQFTLNAEDIKLSGKVDAPNMDITTKKGLDMQNAANTIEKFELKSDGEQINGSVLATSSSEEFITRIDDVVTGDLTLTNKNDAGVILLQGYGLENNILDVKGNVTLNMGGTFLAGRAIQSSGNISITSRNAGMFITSIDSKNDVLEATKNLTLKAAENIDIDGNVVAGNNITANSASIDVFGQANMEAGNNINLTVKKGDVRIRSYVPAGENEIKGTVAAKGGTVKITVGEGNIQIGNETTETSQMDALFAKSSITLKTDKGNIDVKGSTTSDNGTVKMTVGEGDIDISGSALANKGNVTMTITNGNVDVTGSLRAEKGKIDVEIGEGNIQIGNETTKQNEETVVFAKRDINLTTGDGTVTILGNHESTAGDINIKTNEAANTSANVAEFYSYDGTPVLFSANVVETDDVKVPGDITIDAELKANNSVSITTDDGDIEVTKKITVTNGDITIETTNGNIMIGDNGSQDMVRAQNDLNILADNGAVDIAGKISTQDGDITISSTQNSYKAGQKGIIVEETGAITPAKNVNLNVQNGDIEFKRIAAKNANINSSTGDITADTISATDTIRIALSGGDLYLNLAQSKGVAILTSDSSNSRVNTIRADSVDVDSAVTVGKTLPYRSSSGITPAINPSSGTSRSAYSTFTNNFTSNRSTLATLGTTYTPNYTYRQSANAIEPSYTYWQNTPSTAEPNYSFEHFALDDRQTRNYFEVRFVPTWLERDFMSIDFDYSFDNFGIRNATEDELTIEIR